MFWKLVKSSVQIFRIKLIKGRLYQVYFTTQLFMFDYWQTARLENDTHLKQYAAVSFNFVFTKDPTLEVIERSLFTFITSYHKQCLIHTKDVWHVCGQRLSLFPLSGPAHPGSLHVFPSSTGDICLTEFPFIVDSSHRVQPSSLRPADQPAALQSPRLLRLSTTSSPAPAAFHQQMTKEHVQKCFIIIHDVVEERRKKT